MGCGWTILTELNFLARHFKNLVEEKGRFKFSHRALQAMGRTAFPLSEPETTLLEAGATLFDEAKFWHAHEAWEDLWNDLKRRAASEDEILLVQGLIQTAALLLHHQRRNVGGVEKQWAKLRPKLEGWTTAWGFDIATHLAVIQTYATDNTTWNLTASDHQLPRA